MAEKTARNLMTGSGTVSTTAGSRILTFSASQTLKSGATIYISDGTGVEKVTIDSGSGTTWTAVQPAAATGASRAFSTSDTSSSRTRGSSGYLIPNAVHYAYQAPIDDAGNPDSYVYFDTLAPENGVHPYTFDQMVSSFKTAQSAGQVIPDLATRVRRLEGVMRTGRPSNSLSQDYRINDLLQRCYNLEAWANSAGHFGTPPSAGPHPTYAESDFLANGDPA